MIALVLPLTDRDVDILAFVWSAAWLVWAVHKFFEAWKEW